MLLRTVVFFAAGAAATTYDYVIVGGGATGLSLAVRLSEDPTKSVVVLEAGARCATSLASNTFVNGADLTAGSESNSSTVGYTRKRLMTLLKAQI
jgi:choline dehydrogenase-like flavoprotein